MKKLKHISCRVIAAIALAILAAMIFSALDSRITAGVATTQKDIPHIGAKLDKLGIKLTSPIYYKIIEQTHGYSCIIFSLATQGKAQEALPPTSNIEEQTIGIDATEIRKSFGSLITEETYAEYKVEGAFLAAFPKTVLLPHTSCVVYLSNTNDTVIVYMNSGYAMDID